MKSKLTLLILFVAVLSSCKKTTNVDVRLSTSGTLTVKLIDDAGKGLPNVKVSLFDDQKDNYNNLNRILLDAQSTDSNGQVDFGDLNPDNYLIVADSVKVNKVNYNIQEYVQVIVGNAKHKEVKVTDYSGTFSMTITPYITDKPLKNVGVILVPLDWFSFYASTATQLKHSEFSGVIDQNGFIKFKIPSDKSYGVYVYNTITNSSYNYGNNVSVPKDVTVNLEMTIYQP